MREFAHELGLVERFFAIAPGGTFFLVSTLFYGDKGDRSTTAEKEISVFRQVMLLTGFESLL
jgi:hypothetical protein